jgi:hypothetical protein
LVRSIVLRRCTWFCKLELLISAHFTAELVDLSQNKIMRVFLILLSIAFATATYLLIDDQGLLLLDVTTGNTKRVNTFAHRQPNSVAVNNKNKQIIWTSSWVIARARYNLISGITPATNETFGSKLEPEEIAAYSGVFYDNKHSNWISLAHEDDQLHVRLLIQNGTSLDFSPVVSTLNDTGHLAFIDVQEENDTFVALSYDAENTYILHIDIGSGSVVNKVKTEFKIVNVDRYFLDSNKNVINIVLYANHTFTLVDVHINTGAVGAPYKMWEHKEGAQGMDTALVFNQDLNEILLATGVNQKETVYVLTDVAARKTKSVSKASYVIAQAAVYLK